MKALRALIGLLAILLIGAGAAVAALLGPDDTWGGEPVALPDSAPVVATAPQLLNVAGIDLAVTARADGGEVFVGAAHPVHVQDYLRDVTHSEITGLSADGVAGTQLLARDRAYPEASPAELDVWEQQAVGGSVTLAVPLTDAEPVQVAVLPTRAKGAAPQVGIGYALPGAFVGGLGAVVIGLVLLVGTIMWGRRVRRARAATAGETPAPATDTTPEPAPAGLSRSALRLAAIGTVGVLAAGCSVPRQVDHGDASGVVPLEAADVQEMLDDYDARNNPAIKASYRGDASVWKTADTGPFLAVDELDARTHAVQREEKEKAPEDYTHEAVDVFEYRQPSYPVSAVVETDVSEYDDGAGQMLTIYDRQRASAPWKGYSSVYLPDHLVTPLDADAATPDESDRQTALRVDAALEQWIIRGESADLRVTGRVVAERDKLSDPPKGIDRVAHSVDPWGGGPSGHAEPGGPLRVLRVEQGLLVLTDKEWERSLYLDPEWEWTQGTEERRIFGPQAATTVHDQHFAMTAAILVPEAGTPSVIGADVERVLDFPR